jgi:8-oxo-dGTP diphosphatase
VTGEVGGLRIRVVAAVIRRGEEFLVCQRPVTKRHGGLSDHHAIGRELQEELGVAVVHVDAPAMVIADPDSPYDIVFLPTRIAGEPRALEHEALTWGTLVTLAALPLAPSDARFVASLLVT